MKSKASAALPKKLVNESLEGIELDDVSLAKARIHNATFEGAEFDDASRQHDPAPGVFLTQLVVERANSHAPFGGHVGFSL